MRSKILSLRSWLLRRMIGMDMAQINSITTYGCVMCNAIEGRATSARGHQACRMFKGTVSQVSHDLHEMYFGARVSEHQPEEVPPTAATIFMV